MLICFHPSASFLARGKRDGMISVSRLATNTLLWAQEAHAGPVSALAWSPTGLLLASGGCDGMVHVWQATTGAHIYTFSHKSIVTCLSWLPDGSGLCAASGQTIHLFTIPHQTGLSTAA